MYRTNINTKLLADFKKVFTDTDEDILEEIADAINKHGKDYGIDTDEKLQHFLAQVAHEATNPINGIAFDTFEENLNFRWAKLGTQDYWEKYFNTIASPTTDSTKANPNDYKRDSTSVYVNKQKFANRVYNDTYRSAKTKLGNVNTGDGYKFRGRGIFQLTGRYNYQQFTTYYQNRYSSTLDFTTNPDLVVSDKEIAVISALWFFKNKVMGKVSINNNTSVKKVTYYINSKRKGLPHRKSLFNKTKDSIQCN
ncbi:MAG: hypothetical protein GKR88_06140 [Flavobacteriaceae bacterium]|nr:MAG: hypothetical protein GKR88_06140 [Flavobacteriaceae bacterium]